MVISRTPPCTPNEANRTRKEIATGALRPRKFGRTDEEASADPSLSWLRRGGRGDPPHITVHSERSAHCSDGDYDIHLRFFANTVTTQ